MDDSEFLIIGARGQLGLALQAKYPNAQAVDRDEFDITDAKTTDNYGWDKVKTVLNASGYTNVDGAETEDGRAAAWAVNAVGVGNLAKMAIEHGLTLVNISTEYIFDGTKDSHKEDEPPSPLSVYGASKAAGDIAVNLVPKHYILRTSWLIGDGKNFVRTMLELGRRGNAPTVVADQIGRLTFTTELVRAIDYLLQKQAPFGTYNVSNGGEPASWADITRAIFKEAGINLTVTDITTAEYFASKPTLAKRPLKSTLDLSKLQATGFEPTDWRDDLREYIKKEQAK